MAPQAPLTFWRLRRLIVLYRGPLNADVRRHCAARNFPYGICCCGARLLRKGDAARSGRFKPRTVGCGWHLQL